MTSPSEHWDSIFSNSEDSALGWYEKDTSKTWGLLNQINNIEDCTIFLPGAGTSALVDELLLKGAHLILNDISCKALDKVKKRLQGNHHKTQWLCQDIALPIATDIPKIDIWIDRAVLHFLTDEDDINGYFHNLYSNVNIGGHVIFAEFSKIGVDKCAGLLLHRYSIEELSERLTQSFKLISSFNHNYINPNGDSRPYIYGLFKRIN